MIKAVIFDFGGVLCFHPTHQQIESAAKACGLPADDFLRIFWSKRLPYDSGLTSPEDYWRDVGLATGREVDDPVWIADMIRREIDFWSHYDPRVIEWVDELRGKGWLTGILSNLPPPIGDYLRGQRTLLEHFDHITFSYELKLVKPDAAIYQDMIQGLGIAPKEGLFFDDRAENVEGARAVGLEAELYVSWQKMVESLPVRYGLPIPTAQPSPQSTERPL